MPTEYDFSGYATKNDLKCTDGRVIRRDAFKDNDGRKVPLVWQHFHTEPSNILGHAVLENRPDGVYAYCKFNSSETAKNAKLLVEHGDIRSMSIWANELVQKKQDVVHGVIREVSLVFSGANPGAYIDNLSISHDDGTSESFDDEGIIYTDEYISTASEDNKTSKKESSMKHAEGEKSVEDEKDGETLQDIFETLNEKQKTVVYAMLAAVVKEEPDEDSEDMKQSDSDETILAHEGDSKLMKRNVFDNTKGARPERVHLTTEDWNTILSHGQKYGSLKAAFLEAAEDIVHAGTYGIDNIELLFPDAKSVQSEPELYSRDMAWVAAFLGGTRHTPFSRIKTAYADITADNARARGYVTGNEKLNEVYGLLGRTTTPTTIYKKQKLDRDDIVDIVDIDVVSSMKSEMRIMLNEEIARAALVSDGRELISDDKISETSIRPIWTDADMYAHHIQCESDDEIADIIDEITSARQYYKGSGSPTMFIAPGTLTQMLLMKDSLGYRIYKTLDELAATLRVSRIVEVPVMDGLSREVEGTTLNLLAIIVDLRDYTFGADRGGEINMFDDFDIDFNQYKYLLETRTSGALTKLKSALVIEQVAA